MTERFPQSNTDSDPSQTEGFNASEFAVRVKGDSQLMAEAAEDNGAAVADLVEYYPSIALDPEFESRYRHIQAELGNVVLLREAIEDGRIKGVASIHKKRLDQLESDAEDILSSIDGVDIDPNKDAVRQLEHVFSEGIHRVPESLAPDIAAEVFEGSRVVADIVKSEKVTMKDDSLSYLSRKVAAAAAKAINIPNARDEWRDAA